MSSMVNGRRIGSGAAMANSAQPCSARGKGRDEVLRMVRNSALLRAVLQNLFGVVVPDRGLVVKDLEVSILE